MKGSIVLIFLLFLCNLSNAQKNERLSKKLSNGKWISTQDSLSTFIVKEDSIYNFYGKEVVDTFTYRMSKKSCEGINYKSSRKNIYMIWTKKTFSLCYLVKDMEDNNLELLYFVGGKILFFYREN